MATASYTLTAAQLKDFTDKWHTLERCLEYKQIVRLLRQYDLQYGADSLNGADGLAPHVVRGDTGAVSVDTSDANISHELPFFR